MVLLLVAVLGILSGCQSLRDLERFAIRHHAALTYQTSEERNRWLPRYLRIYNGHRCHVALGGLTSQQSLQRLLIAD